MAKCGYHPRMGIGLHEIGGGLVEAVRLKTQIHSRSLSDQLSIEKEEFAVVRSVVAERIKEANSKDERARLEAFGAMLLLGEYFLNLEGGYRSENLSTDVPNRVDSFIGFLKSFDETWKNQMLDKSLVERAENALYSSLKEHKKVAA